MKGGPDELILSFLLLCCITNQDGYKKNPLFWRTLNFFVSPQAPLNCLNGVRMSNQTKKKKQNQNLSQDI